MVHKYLLNKALAFSLLFIVVSIPIALAVLILQRATPAALPPLIAALTVITAGIWAFSQRPLSRLTLLSTLVCLGWAWTYASHFLAYTAVEEAEAALWYRVASIPMILVPVLSYELCLGLLGRPRPKIVWVLYTAAGTCLLLIPGPFLLTGVTSYFWGYYPTPGKAYPAFILYILWSTGLTLRTLWAVRTSRIALPRSSAELLFAAYGLATFAVIDVLPLYGLGIYPLGTLFGVAWCVALSYCLSPRMARSVTSTVRRPDLLGYIQAFSLLFLFYVVVLLVIELFTGVYSYELACLLVAVSTIFAGLIASIQKHMEAVVEHALFKEKEAYETLSEFSRAMASILDLPALTQRIVTTLEKVLGLRTISLFLLDNEKHQYILAGSRGHRLGHLKDMRFAAEHDFPHYLRCTQSIVVRRPSRRYINERGNVITEHLMAMAADVCLPLINKDRLVGFINLGPRRNEQKFSDQELDLLTTLAQNAAVALDNAVLYTDLKRSQMLMRRTDRLRSLETIAGGFAHEIRNPLTSIKTFIQLAPGRRQDEEFITRFSEVVIEDVYRIERLIHEILDYARYREPKFVAEDVNDVVSSCLYFIEVKASSKSIMVDKQLTADLPPVHLDRQQIKQVLLNLFLNALDAMGEHGGRLTVKTSRCERADGPWVQIEVTDTGIGISPTNLEHIFDPFYTTKHESGEREGTGLGLTIVHEIIQEHRGYIDVDSTPGGGTTFFVNLRIDPLKTSFAQEHEEHEKTGLAR